MTSFFERQARARTAGTRLVALFVLALAGVTIAVNLVVATVYSMTIGRYPLPAFDSAGSLVLRYATVPPSLYVWTTLATLAIIAARSLTVIQRLRAGGDVVALMAGGTLIDRGTRDPDERRLLDVVDEMAIASGVPVPRVYRLRGEPGINAFAAGYAASQAAVAVTDGAMRQLTRDELQGVIGHEFSHVLNGDMRLNVEMIGVLAGILFLGGIGQFLMRSSASDRDSRRSGSGLFLVGLAVMLIGYVGLFFGRLIKAALSRQREFLADASSVQFTRNPDGLAGALATIADAGEGSRIVGRHAETLSHMFFASSVDVWLASVFATHPPIPERIRRIDPQFVAARYFAMRDRALRARDGAQDASTPLATTIGTPALGPTAASAAATAFGDRMHDASSERAAVPTRRLPAAPATSASSGTRDVTTGRAPARPPEPVPPRIDTARRQPMPGRTSPAAVVASVGTPAPEHVDYAAKLLGSLPSVIREATTAADSAQALVLAFALAPDDATRKQQLDLLSRTGADQLAQQADRFAPHLRALAPLYRLPAVTLALPSLHSLAQPAREAFIRNVETVIDADQRVTLEEFALLTIVRHHLAADAGAKVPIKYRSLFEIPDDARLVLSLLAHAGGDATERAFARGVATLGLDASAAVPLAEIAFARVAGALGRLRQLAPFPKQTFVAACAETIVADASIAVAEAELLRAIAIALDCPVPPILDSVDAGAVAQAGAATGQRGPS